VGGNNRHGAESRDELAPSSRSDPARRQDGGAVIDLSVAAGGMPELAARSDQSE
jgi:hypothetical protein